MYLCKHVIKFSSCFTFYSDTQLKILPLQFKIDRVLEVLECFRGLEELSIPASEYCMLEPS